MQDQQELIGETTQIELQQSRRAAILKSIATIGLMSSKNLIEKQHKPFHSGDSVIAERDLRGVFVAGEGQPGIKADADWRETYTGSGKRSRSIHYLWAKGESDKKVDTVVEQFDREADLSVGDVFINRALYDDVSSVFPVLLERPNEDNIETGELPKEVMEDRVSNSILVVARLSDVSFGTLDSWEVFVDITIPPKKFFVVLAPQELLNDTQNAFAGSGISVEGVGERNAKIFTSEPVGFEKGNIEIQVPDYETIIREQLAKSEVPLFLHGVRLPT